MFSGTGTGNRLNGIILSINIVVLVVIAIITTSSSNAAVRTQTLNRFAVKNASAVRSLDQTFKQVSATATAFTAGLDKVDVLDATVLREYVRNAVLADNDILIHRISMMRPDHSIAVFNMPNAQVAKDYDWRIYRQPADMPVDTHILNTLNRTKSTWFYQEAMQYDAGSRPGVSLAMPWTIHQTDGDFQSVIWFDIPLVTLHDVTTRALNDQGLLASTTGGYTLLLDTEGNILTEHNILTDSTTVKANTEALMERLDAAPVNNNNLFSLTEPFSGSNAIASRSTVGQTGWHLMSVLPLEEVPVIPSQIFVPIAIVSVVGLFILAWSTSRFVARSVVGPLLNLGEAAQEIGSGDLRYFIEHQSEQDEIGRLARALETMKRNIAHSYDELSRWSRTLEQRVIQRTKELDEARKQSDGRASQLQAVYDESLLVVNESQLRPVLNAFTARLMTLLKATYCAIWLITEDRERLQQVAASDGGQSLGSASATMLASEGLTGEAVMKAAPVVVNDYTSYPQRVVMDTHAPFVRGIAVPLMFVGKPIGAVIVGRPADAPVFNDADSRLLTLFANMVSPSVRNAQLFVRVNEAVQSAERANQVKTRFLASVTHELRTPLNLIINNMDFMRIGAFGDVTPDQVSRLNQTVRSAEHLLYLINDLLDVSKIDAGEMQLFIQPGDITPVLDDLVDNIHAYMEKMEDKVGKIEIVTDIDKDLPQLPVDSRRLRQVLTNLLTNAVKFTREGEVKLSVKREEKGVRFSVSDTGIGIPPEELKNLFAAFERTRQAKESNIEGTGLGLAISKFLVEQHGGEMHVDSISGKGSTFWFTIPLELAPEARPADNQILAVLTSKPE